MNVLYAAGRSSRELLLWTVRETASAVPDARQYGGKRNNKLETVEETMSLTGTNVKRFHVELTVEISDRCLERVNNGVPDPEDFVRAELGWAAESFDGMEIRKLKLLEEKK